MLPTAAFCTPATKYPYPSLIPLCLNEPEDACNTNQQCQWFNPDAPTGPADHCALKQIYREAAATSGTQGADQVCYGHDQVACGNINECEWILVNATTGTNNTDGTDGTNTTDGTNGTDGTGTAFFQDPSTEMNVCTHPLQFSHNESVVDMCANANQSRCIALMGAQYVLEARRQQFSNDAQPSGDRPFCVWNECEMEDATAGTAQLSTSQCGTEGQCAKAFDNATYITGQPGICALAEPVQPSDEVAVCTHRHEFNYFRPAIKQCSQLQDQASCLDGSNSIFCNWNSKYVEPNDAVGTCTHQVQYGQDAQVVKKCFNADAEELCLANSECSWNYPPVAPSIERRVCTHRFQFNTNKKVVEGCAQLDEDPCRSQDQCIWNECANDYGNTLAPCSTEDAPYCVQSNGMFNPGMCSANKNDTIKCVPAKDEDF